MINLYGYAYPSTWDKFPGFVLTKIGDSHRDPKKRMNEQGGAAENEEKIEVGTWLNLKKIKRDHDLHKVLTLQGLHHAGNHKGTEWYKIPGKNFKDAFKYLDNIISDIEGKKIRSKVKLRKLQAQTLTQAMQIVDQTVKKGQSSASIIANLCPRFGKTIWALSFFNQLSDKYGHRIMLIPAYWLSAHSSFISELDMYDDFLDIVQIDTDDPNASHETSVALSAGKRIIIPISLHGEIDQWKKKHRWISKINNTEIFNFVDEGDFGAHTDNQLAKVEFLFSTANQSQQGKIFVNVYASGTNVQRLAKSARGNSIDGVLYTAYSHLEKTEPGFIRRKFYSTNMLELKRVVEELDEKVQPSWSKIWDRPTSNQAFISGMFQALVGDDPLRPELNLSEMCGEMIDCFMLLVSADKKQMKQIKDIADRAIPDWHVKILNGDYTTNRDAEWETQKEINESHIAGKRGVVIIANLMGSRSYGVPAIQASVIAYDRGSIDATSQKVSRPLTPPTKDKPMYNKSLNKPFGHIVELSFDPNRSENIEKLILEEAIMVQRSDKISFAAALTYVLTTINLLKLNEFGYFDQIDEKTMFGIYGDNDILLKVADITPNIEVALKPEIFSILTKVNTDGKSRGNDKRTVVGENAVNSIKKGAADRQCNITDQEKREAEKILNNAVRALNMSATTVYDLANSGDSYNECLDQIEKNILLSKRFESLYGISVKDTKMLLSEGFLNEAILDVIVQNSQLVDTPFA